jgi:isoleucyl-tRNA synthetase
LYECLDTVTKLLAPFAPFLSEELYRNLNMTSKRQPYESVHLAAYPDIEEGAIDADLETKMERAEKIVMLVRAMRMKSNLKVRQPLRRIILPIAHERDRAAVQQMEDVILDEINVKTIEYVTDDSGVARKKARPNFKSIGPKFGKSVQQVAQRIKELNPAEIRDLEGKGIVNLVINGTAFAVGKEDVEIVRDEMPGWLVESENGLTVALDTELNDDLVAEGFAREFVNRVQNMRKDAGFEVTDRIRIYFTGSDKLRSILQEKESYIKNETLAVEFVDSYRPGEYASKLDINGEEAEVGVERQAPNTR